MRNRVNGAISPVEEGGHLELRLWLRMINCSMKMESLLSQRLRKEFTAIGETVNLSQRIEQLTKTCGGPVLLSEQTRACLSEPVRLTDVGPQCVPGFERPLTVYRLEVCPLTNTSEVF